MWLADTGTGVERRKSTRFRLHCEVTCTWRDDYGVVNTIHGAAQNISAGGLFISSPGRPWVGMFATALNLLPSSQLDGGHIVYALAPRVHRIVSWITVIALVYLGHRYVGWRVWAGLLIVMNVITSRQQQAPTYPMLPASRWVLALLALIMLALTFTISPFQMNWQ